MAASGASVGGLTELWARLRFVVIAVVVYRIGAHLFRYKSGSISRPVELRNYFEPLQHVFWWRIGADVDICAWNHALYLGGDRDAVAGSCIT